METDLNCSEGPVSAFCKLNVTTSLLLLDVAHSLSTVSSSLVLGQKQSMRLQSN